MNAGAESRSSDTAMPPSSGSVRKPRFAIFVATAAGLGHLPKAPGTWGSLGGLFLALTPWWVYFAGSMLYLEVRRGDLQALIDTKRFYNSAGLFLWTQISLAVVIAVVGVLNA